MSHKSNSNTEEVMKELEKIAFKKGWIKPELQKQASSNQVQKDYKPTDNMDQNIIKLCSGLRDKGFHVEADVLEDNFVNFKKAENLYNTKTKSYEEYFKEAHPKAAEICGHEVHNIYDVQESMLKSVEKQKKKAKLAAIASLLKYADFSEDKKMVSKNLIVIAQYLRDMGSLIVNDKDSSESGNASQVALDCSKKADEIITLAKSGECKVSDLYSIRSFEAKIRSNWISSAVVNWAWKNNLSSDGVDKYNQLSTNLKTELNTAESIIKKIESENVGKTEEELQVQKELDQNEMKSMSETRSNKAKNLFRLKKLEARYDAIRGVIDKDETITKDPRWKKDYEIILKCFEIYNQTHTLLVTYVNSPTPIDQTRIDNKFTQVEKMLEKLAKAYM